MPWGDVLGERSTFDGNELLLEGDPLVAAQHRRAEADLAIAAAQLGRHVRDLETSGLAFTDRAAEQRERLHEERSDEVRLELASLGTLHLVANALDIGRCHDVVHQCAIVDDLASVSPTVASTTVWSRARTRGCSP